MADLWVKAAIETRRQQAAEERVNKEIRQGKIFPEDRESKIDYYAKRFGWVSYEIEDQALLGGLPEDSPLYEPLQPGSSALGRLTILESLGFNEENVKGSIAFEGMDNYNMKSHWEVLGSERFFSKTDDEREMWLAQLLYNAKYVIATRRSDREKRDEAADNMVVLGGGNRMRLRNTIIDWERRDRDREYFFETGRRKKPYES